MDDRLLTLPPIWLLVLDLFGTQHLIASEEVTITDSRGFVRVFRAGLTEASITEAIGTLGESPTGEPTATLTELYIPGALQWISQGAETIVGRGELSVFPRGEGWERRSVLVSGRVRDSRVRRGDFVDVVIGDQLGDDRGTLLPPSAVVNSDTWPSHADNAADVGYPIVFGEPGVYTLATGASANTTGSPAPMVDATVGAEVLLVCMGRVQAQNVTIRNEDDGSEDSFAITEVEDDLGQLVSVVSLATPGALTVDADTAYHARWDGGGGIYSDLGELLDGAGSVLIWALRRSSVRVDLAALEAVRQELDQYTLGGYVNDASFSPMDWVADNLLPILPISLVFGPDGLAPIVHRYDYALTDIELTLNEDEPGARITDDGVTSSGEPIGGFRLVYAWSVLLERGRRKRTITGDPEQTALNAANIKPDSLCARAFELLAQVDGEATPPTIEEIETRVVYDEATARRILSSTAGLRAIPPKEVQIDVTWPIGARLRLGQIVQVRSRDFYIDRPGRVAELTYSIEGVRVRVLLDAHHERDRYNRV